MLIRGRLCSGSGEIYSILQFSCVYDHLQECTSGPNPTQQYINAPTLLFGFGRQSPLGNLALQIWGNLLSIKKRQMSGKNNTEAPRISNGFQLNQHINTTTPQHALRWRFLSSLRNWPEKNRNQCPADTSISFNTTAVHIMRATTRVSLNWLFVMPDACS